VPITTYHIKGAYIDHEKYTKTLIFIICGRYGRFFIGPLGLRLINLDKIAKNGILHMKPKGLLKEKKNEKIFVRFPELTM
jgi:hypothetical protein